VNFYSRDKWLRRVQRLWERNNPGLYVTPNNAQDYLNCAQEPAVIQMGRQVYLVPADAKAFGDTVTLYLDVLQWLPPYGKEAVLGVASSTSAGKLVNSVGDFINQAVKIGMVAQNTTDGTSATISAIESGTTLVLNADIFVSGESYSILTADEEDYLLESAFDWLLYRAVWELNFFVKEDERVQLSQTLIADAWNALRAWNENLISQSTDDTDLD